MSDCNISYEEAFNMTVDEVMEANAALDFKLKQLEGSKK